MKDSLYNNWVEYKGNYVLFNALSLNFLYIDKDLAKLYKDNTGNLNKLLNIHPDFYKALRGYGFIVEEDKDELSCVRSIINTINNDRTSFRLIINPTLNCNFHCWYCYESHNGKTKMSKDVQNRIILFLKKIAQDPQLKFFQLSFFGGEPLLYYSDVVLPIAEYASKIFRKSNKSFFLDLTTNGYLFNEERLKELRSLGLSSCQITLDGSKERHNNTRFTTKGSGSYEKIISNIKNAVKNGIDIVLRINYTEENLKDLFLIFADFEELTVAERKHLILSMNKVWQEKNEKLGEQVRKMQAKAKEFGMTLPDALLADRVRHSCYADKENEAVINYNGKVYKCNARDFKEDNCEGILDESGNIQWNDFHQLRKNAKLSNPKCLSCSILPICGGGCSQISYDNKKCNYCVNTSKEAKNELIISMFLSEHTKNEDSHA